jgi:hypothetical protein
LRPPIIDLVPKLDDAVVGTHDDEDQNHNDNKNDDESDHLWSFLNAEEIPAIDSLRK